MLLKKLKSQTPLPFRLISISETSVAGFPLNAWWPWSIIVQIDESQFKHKPKVLLILVTLNSNYQDKAMHAYLHNSSYSIYIL